MSAKRKFLETVKKKLDAWKIDVERLQANAHRIGREDMGRYSAAVQDILARIQRVEKLFTVDDRSSAETWQTLKAHVEAGCRDIEAQIRQVRREFSL
ncbi:MAG TPA: hypothetical protein VLT88_03205 [Desulfosarcina sp.]|nr:hypothetical protein [Desulfosarcina sp.]